MSQGHDLYGVIITNERIDSHMRVSKVSNCSSDNFSIVSDAEALSFNGVVQKRWNTRTGGVKNQIEKAAALDGSPIDDERNRWQTTESSEGTSKHFPTLLEQISSNLAAR
jgi:hypothetical protein